MRKNCEFKDCDREATLFYESPDGELKYWYCIEHYDRMAAHYLKSAEEEGDRWSITMVKCNGW